MAVEAATIFVIDDEESVRESLARLLRSEGMDVQAFGDARDFLATLGEERLGCVLLDVSMPGLTGPELHELLRLRGCGLPVVYLTGRSSVATGVRAIKLGAADFLEKPVDAETLLPVLRQALERHCEALARSRRVSELRWRFDALSEREREVMQHVVRGRLNKQIAGDLGIAEKTVKVHRGRVMAKMRVRSVADLVRLHEELEQAGRSAAIG